MPGTKSPSPGNNFTFRKWPFYWLARANGRYVRKMEVALKQIGLDVPRWRVLMTLHEEGCASVSELAEHAIAKLSTMTRIIQRMQADGLVSCRPSAEDGRVTEVVLTARGKVAGMRAWETANLVYDQAFAHLTKPEIRTFITLLRKLAANLDKAEV